MSKDSDQIQTAPRKFKLGPLGNLRIGCAMRNAMSAVRRVGIPAPDTTSAAYRPKLARYG
jgi:hypothetical protein